MKTETFSARTWIDIDLTALISNYRAACALTKAKVTCALKANAYGHGLIPVAQSLLSAGCESFAVSCVREGLALRRHGVQTEILVMGIAEDSCLRSAIDSKLVLTAASIADLIRYEKAAEADGREATVQLKLDTGFHRLGFPCTAEAAQQISDTVKALRSLKINGLYSHLGLISRERDILQHDALIYMKTELQARGIEFDDIHLCDSIGLVRYPEWHGSRVRVGAILYGVTPYNRQNALTIRCKETLAFRTTVAQLRTVEAGEPVGYSDDMVVTRRTKVATLCAGYGDGYPRHLSNGRGRVSIRGKLAPVLGLVCMDQTMVDVTDIPEVQEGDTVDLLGGDIPYEDFSQMAATNRNECITILSQRPVRVYWKDGQIWKVSDSLLDF